MSDESILGLLLRAHRRCAEQQHGEQYVFDNISASNCFEQACNSIECAIHNLSIAERYVSMQSNRKPKRVSGAVEGVEA